MRTKGTSQECYGGCLGCIGPKVHGQTGIEEGYRWGDMGEWYKREREFGGSVGDESGNRDVKGDGTYREKVYRSVE